MTTKEGEHSVNLYSNDSVEVANVRFSVLNMIEDLSQAKKISIEKSLSSDHDCPKCSYMERVYESISNQLMALEEFKETSNCIKEVIKEYYNVDRVRYAPKYIPEVLELSVELPCSYHGKSAQISKQEAENFKTAITNLTEKLKNLQNVQDDVKNMRGQLFESHMNRLSMQQSIKEKTVNLESKSSGELKRRLDSLDERSKTYLELIEKNHVVMQKNIEVDQIKSEISILSSTLNQLKAEELNFMTMKKHISKLDSELNLSIGKRDDLTAENDKIMESFQLSRSKHHENIQNLNIEKTNLTGEITSLQKEIQDEKSQNEVLTRQNHTLEIEINKLEEEIQKLNDINKELEQSRQIASDKEEISIKLHRSIDEASTQFEHQLIELSKRNSELLKEKLNVVEELNKLEHSLETKNEEVQDLTRNNYSSIAQCTILEQQVHIQNDHLEVQKSIDSMQEKNEKIKNILLDEISHMASKLKLQSEECMSLSKKVESFKKTLDEKNNFKKELKRITSDIKLMKKVYVPVRGEQTDELLAEVLGYRVDWMSIEVKRLEKGKYVFGNKEVELFIDGNCLMVGFGRAKMDIEEFLEVYVPLELQKQKLNKTRINY